METTPQVEKSAYCEGTDTMPTGLLSAVDALRYGRTASDYGDDDDDDDSAVDHSSIEGLPDGYSSDPMNAIMNSQDHNRSEQINIIYSNTAGYCLERTANHSPTNTQNWSEGRRKELEDFEKEISKSQIQVDSNQTCLDIDASGALTSGSIQVPTYAIDNTTKIVLVPDLYSIVRQACGTCSPLRALFSRLSIAPRRCEPFLMLRLKHVGAVNLEVKCCSYILLQEFLQVILRYKKKSITPDMLNLLPAIDISSLIVPFDQAAAQSKLRRKAALTQCDVIHTFIVKGEVVVCVVELQQAVESVFGGVLSTSLAKLGIHESRFTALQLDEVMDFVDIDESNMTAGIFYITKKDAERLFQYTEALFNVENLKIKWLDPLRISTCELAPSNENQQKGEKENPWPTSSDLREASKAEQQSKDCKLEGCPGNVEGKFDNLFVEETRIKYCPNVSSPSETIPRKPFVFSEEITSQPGSSRVYPLDNKCAVGLEQEMSQPVEPHQRHNQSDAAEIQESTVVDLKPLEDNETTLSSPVQSDNESLFSETDSCSSICTYTIDGNEVVCIPDVHKIVIHLYGQSVQVGYYLQRMQIPTQRFSTVHVKRLKALNALNSKATLCTYILKSDALRLFKMYDVFCTDSKLEHIQWNGPVCLEAMQGSQLTNDDSMLTSRDVFNAAQEPIEMVKIPTFLIDGEVVVSVPDAHKVVQVLNGQSVQVRYNMDKLGIVKRRYSYSQVYQLRAISDLKRPSMCTFITKNDADKLLGHYLTTENACRLKYIQWMAPVELEEKKALSAITCQEGLILVDNQEQGDEINVRNETSCPLGSVLLQMENFGKKASFSSFADKVDSVIVRTQTYDDRVEEMSCQTTIATVSPRGKCPGDMTKYDANGGTSEVIISPVSGKIPCTVDIETPADAENSTATIEHCEAGRKRSYDALKEKSSVLAELKRLKDDKNDIAATLERKETEMRILHDAYQQQVAHERKQRLEAQKEIEELRASNAELCKNLERKESEMKILHDSYQYQMRKEREKRQELENDLIDLRGSVAFASGVSIHEPKVKQENQQ